MAGTLRSSRQGLRVYCGALNPTQVTSVERLNALEPGSRAMDRRNRRAFFAVSLAGAFMIVALAGSAHVAEGAVNGSSEMSRHVFGPGESFEFRLRYGFLETGRAKIEIGRDVDSEAGEIWPIKVDARTTGTAGFLYDMNTLFVSHFIPEEDRTLGFDRDSVERGDARFTTMRLDHANQKAEVVRKQEGRPEERRTYEVGPASHDIASAIFWLRDRPLNVGDVEKIRVFTGRKAWDMKATVTGTERIRTQWGRMEAKHIRLHTQFDGDAAARRDIEIWMANAPHHVPLAIRADLALGSIRADLREYAPPRDSH